MSMDLVLCGMIVLLVTPTAVELSYWMGVLGFGHTILMRDFCSGTISLVMLKRPASSYLEAYYMTFLMICAMVRTGPLWRGIGKSSESIMWAPARLQDLLTLG